MVFFLFFNFPFFWCVKKSNFRNTESPYNGDYFGQLFSLAFQSIIFPLLFLPYFFPPYFRPIISPLLFGQLFPQALYIRTVMYSISGGGSVSQVVGQRMFLGTTPVHCTQGIQLYSTLIGCIHLAQKNSQYLSNFILNFVSGAFCFFPPNHKCIFCGKILWSMFCQKDFFFWVAAKKPPGVFFWPPWKKSWVRWGFFCGPPCRYIDI